MPASLRRLMVALLLAGVAVALAAPPTAAQVKKPGVSYKDLLKAGGHVVGMRPSSIFILKDGILYSCRINSRRSMIGWCKAMKAEGEKDLPR